MIASSDVSQIEVEPEQSVKCLVWDLDNTVWTGVLLEDKHVSLRPEVPEIF